jgi:AcrR family transcriptional regulator
LHDRYGVDLSKLKWIVQARELFPVYSPTAKIEYVDDKKAMVERLISGELDALITDISDTKLFLTLESHLKVKRLFPDYVTEDQRLYKETGIYTPVHMIVMSRKLDRHHPELAAKLYAAFEQAKSVAYDDILSDRGGFSTIYLRERLKEQIENWGDPWKYGMKANKTTIDTFIKYNVEQGMIVSEPFYADIFAAGTLET